jgi:hypothetical protein
MGPMLDRWYCCAFVLLVTNQKPDDEAYYRMTYSAMTGTLKNKARHGCFAEKIESTRIKEDATSNSPFLHTIVLGDNHDRNHLRRLLYLFLFYLSVSMRAVTDCYLLVLPTHPKSYDLPLVA